MHSTPPFSHPSLTRQTHQDMSDACPQNGVNSDLSVPLLGPVDTQMITATPTRKRFGRFELSKQIGAGSSGSIHLGRDVQTGEEVAVKLVSSNKTLMAEASFYRQHGGEKGIPRMKWWGRPDHDMWALILDRLSVSIRQLRENRGSKGLPINGFVLLALQMLERVRMLHDIHMLHRDIKPENFMLGVGANRDTVYLIDFGLTCPWVRKNDAGQLEHIESNTGQGFSGTPDFASLNVHNGHSPSRRDDVESLCYVFIFLLRGSLPWQNKRSSSHEAIITAIAEHKRRLSPATLCRGLPPPILQLLMYTRALGFREAPDYNVCEFFFCHQSTGVPSPQARCPRKNSGNTRFFRGT